MSEFLTLEEAAQQLSVSESDLRSWIKQGNARATRRGGDYQLRSSEVERLRSEGPSPSRPKVYPPRSSDPESYAGERERRRRMGRRNSDFTLEMLNNEIRSAISAGMEPFLERLQNQGPDLASQARWDLEKRSLELEIERLTSLPQNQELEMENARLREQLAQFEAGGSEEKSLREQVKSLTYRLQMASTGSSGPSDQEARRTLERLADAEAEMRKKDQLIDQGYAEISELRSKLEGLQRAHYELQQRYERLSEEWSQLAARQMTEIQQQQHQPQAPTPGPDKKAGWGGLFRMGREGQ